MQQQGSVNGQPDLDEHHVDLANVAEENGLPTGPPTPPAIADLAKMKENISNTLQNDRFLINFDVRPKSLQAMIERLTLIDECGAPRMRVLSCEKLCSLRRFPRSTEGFTVDALDLAKQRQREEKPLRIIFVTHRWCKGKETDPDDSPRKHDTDNNDQAKMLLKTVADDPRLSTNTYFWIDYPCMRQDGDPGAWIATLPLYVACATDYCIINYPDVVRDRAWCRVEMLMAFSYMSSALSSTLVVTNEQRYLGVFATFESVPSLILAVCLFLIAASCLLVIGLSMMPVIFLLLLPVCYAFPGLNHIPCFIFASLRQLIILRSVGVCSVLDPREGVLTCKDDFSYISELTELVLKHQIYGWRNCWRIFWRSLRSRTTRHFFLFGILVFVLVLFCIWIAFNLSASMKQLGKWEGSLGDNMRGEDSFFLAFIVWSSICATLAVDLLVWNLIMNYRVVGLSSSKTGQRNSRLGWLGRHLAQSRMITVDSKWA